MAINFALYSYVQVVLPALLEQVVGCRDAISQEYLLDSIAHVFSDEFHLATLPALLRATVDLQPAVNIRQIYSALIDRCVSPVAPLAARSTTVGVLYIQCIQ